MGIKTWPGEQNWNKAEHKYGDKGWNKDRVEDGNEYLNKSRNKDWDMVWNIKG
jgi:hypothetical protein